MITEKESRYTLKKSKLVEESFIGVDLDEYYDHINRLFVLKYPKWSIEDFINDLESFNDKDKKKRNRLHL